MSKTNPVIFLEVLFWKTSGECFELTEGYGTLARKKLVTLSALMHMYMVQLLTVQVYMYSTCMLLHSKYSIQLHTYMLVIGNWLRIEQSLQESRKKNLQNYLNVSRMKTVY